ncbi:hypothetical protein C2845_PM05G14210 [Panicum miliaceum]|uniref:Uncharacterized protein n=1 Tax=Panicum miliaceum TaxID=4540 RepID=A0A3L6SXN7_PANMI|nr:hypothetical protein C2845_PM05G14210 [Panicum miliaceum]
MVHVELVWERRIRYQKTDDIGSRPTNTTIDLRLSAMYAEASSLVGMDGPRDELIQLMDGEDGLSVISIVGFRGLGKTTLANEIYRKLEGKFQCRAFVSVSQKPNIRKILRTMLLRTPTWKFGKSIYPEDYTIDKKDLVRRWIAEGFICKACGIDPEDIAKSYFNELINRSLIQPVYTDYNDEVMSCRQVFEEDVGILAQLPLVVNLELFIRGTPEDKIIIRGRGFPVLKHFNFGCSRISCLAFVVGAMPKLEKLVLRINAKGWEVWRCTYRNRAPVRPQGSVRTHWGRGCQGIQQKSYRVRVEERHRHAPRLTYSQL